ncbi:MAG: hypothetical protein KBE71_10360 [Laribacter sp.]|nr:hypothetical protein [Laribacter sp.]MBP9528741.1 hypothetical protein [Laribacter sp.]
MPLAPDDTCPTQEQDKPVCRRQDLEYKSTARKKPATRSLLRRYRLLPEMVACNLLPNDLLLGPMSTAEYFCG